MITETTAISCAAFGALSTGLGIAAGIGWMRCAEFLKRARDWAAYWKNKAVTSEADLKNAAILCWDWKRYADQQQARATDLEDRLQTIERQRSDSTRRGNLTKAAKRKALVDATTAAVARANADRAEPVASDDRLAA